MCFACGEVIYLETPAYNWAEAAAQLPPEEPTRRRNWHLRQPRKSRAHPMRTAPCPGCGETYTGRANSMYCSVLCGNMVRQRIYNRNKRERMKPL